MYLETVEGRMAAFRNCFYTNYYIKDDIFGSFSFYLSIHRFEPAIVSTHLLSIDYVATFYRI